MELEKEIVELRRTNEILKVRKRLETVKTCQLYAYIRKRRNQKTVKVMCKVLTVSVVIETKGSELSLNEAFPEELECLISVQIISFFLNLNPKRSTYSGNWLCNGIILSLNFLNSVLV